MIKYTRSATLDTFDFIKRVIYYSDIGIQFSYILYVIYRLIFNMGNFILNIALLSITSLYLIYYLATKREFYTEDLKKQRKIVRLVVKWIKRAIYVYLITASVYALAFAPTPNDNMAILMTLLMIVGLIFSFIFDLTVKEIDKRISLVGAAVLYDIEQFTKQRTKTTKALKLMAIDLSAAPKVVDEKMIKRLHKVDEEQAHKAERKKHYFRLVAHRKHLKATKTLKITKKK